MNGATAEPLLRTIKPPKIKRTKTIGINQYFFLCLRKSINSNINDILSELFVHVNFFFFFIIPI